MLGTKLYTVGFLPCNEKRVIECIDVTEFLSGTISETFNYNACWEVAKIVDSSNLGYTAKTSTSEVLTLGTPMNIIHSGGHKAHIVSVSSDELMVFYGTTIINSTHVYRSFLFNTVKSEVCRINKKMRAPTGFYYPIVHSNGGNVFALDEMEQLHLYTHKDQESNHICYWDIVTKEQMSKKIELITAKVND
jgi:hypothetical protein